MLLMRFEIIFWDQILKQVVSTLIRFKQELFSYPKTVQASTDSDLNLKLFFGKDEK